MMFVLLSVSWEGKSPFETQLILVTAAVAGGTSLLCGLSVVPVTTAALQGLVEPSSPSQLQPPSAACQKRGRGSGLPLAGRIPSTGTVVTTV